MAAESKIVRFYRGLESDVDESFKVQAQVDTYTHWVLDHLVGLRGRSVSDVAYFIIRDWIQDHREELESLGISAQIADGRLVLRRGSGESGDR